MSEYYRGGSFQTGGRWLSRGPPTARGVNQIVEGNAPIYDVRRGHILRVNPKGTDPPYENGEPVLYLKLRLPDGFYLEAISTERIPEFLGIMGVADESSLEGKTVGIFYEQPSCAFRGVFVDVPRGEP